MVNRGLKVSKHSDLSWYKSSQEVFAGTECCGAMGFRGWEVPIDDELPQQEQLSKRFLCPYAVGAQGVFPDLASECQCWVRNCAMFD